MSSVSNNNGRWRQLFSLNRDENGPGVREGVEEEPGMKAAPNEASVTNQATNGTANEATNEATNEANEWNLARRRSSNLTSSIKNGWLKWSTKGDNGAGSSGEAGIQRMDDGKDEQDRDRDTGETETDDLRDGGDEEFGGTNENDDVIEDVSNSTIKKSRSTWTFWNSSVNGNANTNGATNATANGTTSGTTNGTGTGTGSGPANAKGSEKSRDRERSLPNTILRLTPSIPTRQDFLNASASNPSNSENGGVLEDGSVPQQDEEGEDDAVLYKPHDNPKQFEKINTHTNENLKENTIVPDWKLCLPASKSSSAPNLADSMFGSSSTSNQGNVGGTSKVDMKNWRQFLNQLSSKFGFSSQSLTSVVDIDGKEDDGSNNKDKVEQEFNSLYEKTYKLYGRSLSRLPPNKRACLPNYDKYYTTSSEEVPTLNTRRGFSRTEEDNTISISNDPMGNLIINRKPNTSKNTKYQVNQPDVVSRRSGPLTKIKKILIIGVHGFFPTKMIRPLIGAPKGTSLKFANEAEKAVIRYCVENNLINEEQSSNVSIQKIALEKEGKIFDRVQFFTDILSKWEAELNDTDFIFIASHSQGSVVSIIMLAKLIKMGILRDPIKKRIGILAMAGINNGPFYGVDKSFFMKAYSAIEHESMTELFELTKFTSEQSLVLKESMQIIINVNVKICLIGSINDQLVPLYSALSSHIFHPNIYRACYIDHSSQAPVFIQKLVSMCCQLQNLGFFDNNVLKELSTVLAGPFTGGGHSKIYNDGKVYDLGIKFALDTDDMIIPFDSTLELHDESAPANHEGHNHDALVASGVGTYGATDAQANEGGGPSVRLPVNNQVYIKEYNISKIGSNPFILPWCLRGLLFNVEKNWPNNNKLLTVNNADELGKNGFDEINELHRLFEEWKPDTKALKDLKFRLNGIRASKL